MGEHPSSAAEPVLAGIDLMIGVGEHAGDSVREFAAAVGAALPRTPRLEPDEALAWFRGANGAPIVFRQEQPRGERLRHRRKYASGTLGPDKSFYFRGPEHKLQLAQNLALFVQIAEGVDDDTWLFHLHAGDYSAWIRAAIKDQELADEIAALEATALSADDSRAAVADAIERRYTASA